MSNKKVVTVPLSELKETFFIRVCLNEDHVAQLARLYESGAELPPLTVARETKSIIDGRHRKAALERLGRKEADCILVNSASPAEFILMALTANVGGPLPPSPADINHTIQLLLEQKVPRTQIVRRITEMTPFPQKFVRRHIDDVQSELARARLHRAMNAVADGGLNVPQAAEQFAVNPQVLRDKIRGIKRKKAALGLDEIKAGLTSKFKSTSISNAALVKKLIEDYRDGEAMEKHVEQVIDCITMHIKRMACSHRDWVKRFDALRGKDETPVEKPPRAAKAANGKTNAALRKMGLGIAKRREA